MSKFHFLKQYVILPGTEISSDDKHVFYPTGTDEIESIEDEWGGGNSQESLSNFIMR